MIDIDAAWQEHWDAALSQTQERSPEFAFEDYYVSGRASKAHPNKEDAEWWAENGPKFARTWLAWREHCGLKLWEFPDVETGEMQPGIEVEVWAYGDDGMQVRSIIDRVMVDDNDNLYLVDLKTGSSTPAFPMQLALNNLGMIHTFGVSAKFAGFWSARKGGVLAWTPLERFTEDWLWDQVSKAYEIRDRQLFIPQPTNLCNSACGVRQWCRAMGGVDYVGR